MSALLFVMLCFNQLLLSMAESAIINLCCPDVHAYKKGNKEKVLATKHRCEEDQEPIVIRILSVKKEIISWIYDY